jgi:hypothetical protein
MQNKQKNKVKNQFVISSMLSEKGDIEFELHVLLHSGIQIEPKLSRNIVGSLNVLHLVNSTSPVLVKIEALTATYTVL